MGDHIRQERVPPVLSRHHPQPTPSPSLANIMRRPSMILLSLRPFLDEINTKQICLATNLSHVIYKTNLFYNESVF